MDSIQVGPRDVSARVESQASIVCVVRVGESAEVRRAKYYTVGINIEQKMIETNGNQASSMSKARVRILTGWYSFLQRMEVAIWRHLLRLLSGRPPKMCRSVVRAPSHDRNETHCGRNSASSAGAAAIQTEGPRRVSPESENRTEARHMVPSLQRFDVF